MSEAYSSRGVSATKDEVHSAISKQDKGVFPGAFCKLIEDPCGDRITARQCTRTGRVQSLARLYKVPRDGDYSRSMISRSMRLPIES